MPLLKPQINEALRRSGIPVDERGDDSSLQENLKDSGLGLRPVLEQVEFIMQNGSSDSSKLRAAELALKAHKVLSEGDRPLPSITINISDPGAPRVNPILFPREMELAS